MSGAPRILLVDDDEALTGILAEYLRAEGFAADCAADAASAARHATETAYDALVLDVMMPGRSGLELLKDIRREADTPVLMLTARAEELDRVLGLELGADDYLASRSRRARWPPGCGRSSGGASREPGPTASGPAASCCTAAPWPRRSTGAGSA